MTLQQRIDRLQARCDALKGRKGYTAMLERLKNARLAALAGGRNA